MAEEETGSVIRTLPIPKGFDKSRKDHVATLRAKVDAYLSTSKQMRGYGLWRYDDTHMKVLLAPVDWIAAHPDDIKAYRLTDEDIRTPADSVKRIEAMKRYLGYYVVSFDKINRIAMLKPLDESTVFVRDQFAKALHVNPWDIDVMPTPKGGWRVRILFKALIYSDSANRKAVQDAVDMVGKDGWYFTADADNGIITVIPATPPTFPATIPMPKAAYRPRSVRRTYVGQKLPELGAKTGEDLYIDWKDTPGVLVAGTSNGGKSVTINDIIYGFLAAGGQIAVCDDRDKSVDFRAWRPWVMDDGWGCESVENIVAVLRMVYRMCESRSELIRQYNAENYWGLPEDVRPPLTLLVCDEIAQWAVKPPKVSGSKDDPMVIQNLYEIGLAEEAYMLLIRISQKARFAGVCFLYSSQSVTREAGLDPKARGNLQAKFLQGANVSPRVVEQVLEDTSNYRRVPRNVIETGRAIGAGTAVIANQGTFVYKSAYEEGTNDDGTKKSYSNVLHDRLMEVRPVEENYEQGTMSWETILKYCPRAANKPSSGEAASMLEDPIQIEPVTLRGADGKLVDATDIAAKFGM